MRPCDYDSATFQQQKRDRVIMIVRHFNNENATVNMIVRHFNNGKRDSGYDSATFQQRKTRQWL
jgi:hypothetical protein